jgi:uncharacterized repeat protein (TIGR03843 family)
LPLERAPTNTQDDGSILLTEADAMQTLASGVMREQGLLPYSSNHSFLVTVAKNDLVLPAVYKPQRGESPLWDFAWGSLCKRETAAYEVSRLLDWGLVPPTVLRNGTRGVGSVQLYIDNDDEEHYFTIQADARYAPALRRIALFDFLINNADRKSGHCLVDSSHRVWAIDHGICFHTEYKLRTVIWEFSGAAIDLELMEDLTHFRAQLCDETSEAWQALCALLTPTERAALLERVEDLLRSATFPAPDIYRRNYPWPPI